MYIVVYPPFAFLCFVLFGPFGVITAFFTILQYSNMILAALIEVVVMPKMRAVVFDKVLSHGGLEELVRQGANQKPTLTLLSKIRAVTGRFLFHILPQIIVREIILLFVGMIPVIGPCLVIIIRAPCKARILHGRYYRLNGWDKAQQQEFQHKHKGSYAAFGISALIFEMVPFLSILTIFTNIIGAALWSIDLETSGSEGSIQIDCIDTAKASGYSAFVTRAELGS